MRRMSALSEAQEPQQASVRMLTLAQLAMQVLLVVLELLVARELFPVSAVQWETMVVMYCRQEE